MSNKNDVVCPRCLGKGHVDKDDIIRLKRENEWTPGSCAYCNGSGCVSIEFSKENNIDDANIVNDSEGALDLEALFNPVKSMKEDEKSGSEKSVLSITIISVLAIIFLFILSFIYVYLTDLNPIIYFNFIAWFFFAAFLTIPISVIAGEGTIKKIVTSLALSTIAAYIAIGMESSIFFTTYMDAIFNDGSMWLPKVDFSEIFETLFSWDIYNQKMDFLSQNNSFSISYRARPNGLDLGALKPIFRYIEVGGFFIIPLYQIFKK